MVKNLEFALFLNQKTKYNNAVPKWTLSLPNLTISQLVGVNQLRIKPFYSIICFQRRGGQFSQPLPCIRFCYCRLQAGYSGEERAAPLFRYISSSKEKLNRSESKKRMVLMAYCQLGFDHIFISPTACLSKPQNRYISGMQFVQNSVPLGYFIQLKFHL